MMEVSFGPSPVRVSKAETSPLYEPPTSRLGSFGLYSRHTSGEGGASCVSGELGLFTSQMYDRSEALSMRGSWNCRMEKATASFLPPSGYHEMLETVRLISEGSLKTDKVFAFGGSDEWSAYSPAKYSS